MVEGPAESEQRHQALHPHRSAHHDPSGAPSTQPQAPHNTGGEGGGAPCTPAPARLPTARLGRQPMRSTEPPSARRARDASRGNRHASRRGSTALSPLHPPRQQTCATARGPAGCAGRGAPVAPACPSGNRPPQTPAPTNPPGAPRFLLHEAPAQNWLTALRRACSLKSAAQQHLSRSLTGQKRNAQYCTHPNTGKK